MSMYFDKPRLKGINASRGQAALKKSEICKERNTAAGEIHKTANWILNARRGRSKQQKKKAENIYLHKSSCRLVENGRRTITVSG